MLPLVVAVSSEPFLPLLAISPALALLVVLPPVAVVAGYWTYRDAKRRGYDDGAPFVGVIVGGALLAGSVPSVVALAVAPEAAAQQGFPTALRILPGVLALAVYLYFR